MLRCTLFGHLHVWWNDEPIALPTKSAAALLAYLLLERETPQPREQIATLLWPDLLEEKGRRNLRQTLLRLRKVLPESWDGYEAILTQRNTLQWNPNYPIDVDVFRFDALMRDLESALPTWDAPTTYRALELLQRLSDLYTGNLLQDLDLLNDFYAAWLLPWRQKYQQQIVAVLARLAEYEAHVGRLHRMEALARRQLLIDPESEVAHRQLMRAWLAQQENARAVQHYQTNFGEDGEVSLPPSAALQHLYEQGVSALTNETHIVRPIPHNLPAEMSPFYGREEEKEDLLMRLAASDYRLMTITGLGGVGKTRLALTVARQFVSAFAAIEPRFPGGVWFVSLVDATTSDHETLADFLLHAIGRPTRADESAFDTLVEYLQHSPTLLVLDNLEHLPGIQHFVSRLLEAVPHLKILATSRRPLGVFIETVHLLEGLPVPRTPDERTSSVALFLERFQRVGGKVDDAAETRTLVAHICNALEGWPLALELAAGWGNRLALPVIAHTVANTLEILRTTMPDIPARQRSIEAVLQSTYALLTPNQQHILQSFAIFQGGATAEALEAIVGARFEDLALLVDRALLTHREERYTVHELIRQFAARHLEQSNARQTIERAHATYYLQWLVAQQKALFGAQPSLVVKRIRLERYNIERAWRWAATHGEDALLAKALPVLVRFYQLSGLLLEGEALLQQTVASVAHTSLARDMYLALAHFYIQRGKHQEANTILETLLADAPLTKHQRAQWAFLKGKMLYFQEPVLAKCQPFYEEAVQLAQEVGDTYIILRSLLSLEMLRNYDGHFMPRILELARSVDDILLKRDVAVFLGAVGIQNRRYAEALMHWREALRISIDLADEYMMALLYNNIGDALREQGDFPAAEASFRQALQSAEKHHFLALQGNVFEGWARLCVLWKKYHRALQLAQHAIRLAEMVEEEWVYLTALATQGHAYAGLREWQRAREVYQQTIQYLETYPQVALEGLAGLAYVSWKQKDRDAATAFVDRFLQIAEQTPIAGFASPELSYKRIAMILRALGRLEESRRLQHSIRWVSHFQSDIA